MMQETNACDTCSNEGRMGKNDILAVGGAGGAVRTAQRSLLSWVCWFRQPQAHETDNIAVVNDQQKEVQGIL